MHKIVVGESVDDDGQLYGGRIEATCESIDEEETRKMMDNFVEWLNGELSERTSDGISLAAAAHLFWVS